MAFCQGSRGRSRPTTATGPSKSIAVARAEPPWADRPGVNWGAGAGAGVVCCWLAARRLGSSKMLMWMLPWVLGVWLLLTLWMLVASGGRCHIGVTTPARSSVSDGRPQDGGCLFRRGVPPAVVLGAVGA